MCVLKCWFRILTKLAIYVNIKKISQKNMSKSASKKKQAMNWEPWLDKTILSKNKN